MTKIHHILILILVVGNKKYCYTILVTMDGYTPHKACIHVCISLDLVQYFCKNYFSNKYIVTAWFRGIRLILKNKKHLKLWFKYKMFSKIVKLNRYFRNVNVVIVLSCVIRVIIYWSHIFPVYRVRSSLFWSLFFMAIKPIDVII